MYKSIPPRSVRQAAVIYTPGQSCTGTPSQQPRWEVSVSCTIIETPVPPTVPGGGPACSKCVISAVGSGNGGGGGVYYDNNGVRPGGPQYICVATNPRTGECSKVIPYTPIIIDPMDPYNYYSGLLSIDQINDLLKVQYAEARQAVDTFLEANKLPTGGFTTETREFIRR